MKSAVYKNKISPQLVGNLTDILPQPLSSVGRDEFKVDSLLNPYYIQGFSLLPTLTY